MQFQFLLNYDSPGISFKRQGVPQYHKLGKGSSGVGVTPLCGHHMVSDVVPCSAKQSLLHKGHVPQLL